MNKYPDHQKLKGSEEIKIWSTKAIRVIFLSASPIILKEILLSPFLCQK